MSRPTASSSSTRNGASRPRSAPRATRPSRAATTSPRDDRLRSVIDVERISPDSYISIAGWAFQGLRVDDVQKQIPIALPAIDARFRLDDLAGGKVELQANSLSIIRIEGQDTQRAFASARWDLRRLTPWGQELVLTAYGRGDVYHTDDAESTPVRSTAAPTAGMRGRSARLPPT